MSLRIIGVTVALLSGALALIGGCGGGDGTSGTSGSGGTSGTSGTSGSGGAAPSCDATTKGFVHCGPSADLFTNCQPGTFCEDPNLQSCTLGCASDVNCGCGEECVGATCIKSSVCGDGKCNGKEDASSCAADCTAGDCGNGKCDAGESAQSCPMDCSATSCGNGTCDAGETTLNCPEDCTVDPCGNGVCDPGETAQICPLDCKPMPCGDGTCDGSETFKTCQVDCQPLHVECNSHCDAYNFFDCLQPGALQTCYDSCAAATGPVLKQFNNCAATGATFCDLSCFDFL